MEHFLGGLCSALRYSTVAMHVFSGISLAALNLEQLRPNRIKLKEFNCGAPGVIGTWKHLDLVK